MYKPLSKHNRKWQPKFKITNQKEKSKNKKSLIIAKSDSVLKLAKYIVLSVTYHLIRFTLIVILNEHDYTYIVLRYYTASLYCVFYSIIF